MTAKDLRSLIEKLNTPTKKALEKAAALCQSKTHYTVDVEHWVLALLDEEDLDIHAVFAHFQLSVDAVKADIQQAFEGYKTGNDHAPALSPYLVSVIEKAWMHSSLEFDEPNIRSGVLLFAFLTDASLSSLAHGISPLLEKIDTDTLKVEFDTITASSYESIQQGGQGIGAKKANTKALDQYTIDLTERARSGQIDPVLGRDTEMRQMIDILTRRRQNNPILTGEAGVGKTAVVEGLALKIVNGDVPDKLKNITLRTLDMGLLQAGAGVKGEFENRLKDIIEEVKQAPTPIVLFIDEAHTMIGAGGQEGKADAANLLKPALARGELKTIAATTWAEYKKYFEKDAALSRRFQVVAIDEPSEAIALDILRGLAPIMSDHHGVDILDEALVDAVSLSTRYIPGRQLPDKAISVLDTACARVGLSQASESADIEHERRRIASLERELSLLNSEINTDKSRKQHIEELEKSLKKAKRTLTKYQKEWQQEKDLVDELTEFKQKRQTALSKDSAAGITRATNAYIKKKELLEKQQGENARVYEQVSRDIIADIIADWTGIPVGKMKSSEVGSIISLSEKMKERVIGQDHALERLAQVMKTSSAKLTDPKRPIGVFMLAGPSGVGKTETALALAEHMYGSEANITTINMSEFKEEHKVSLLMGSPPGYVGYGEGGVLTEAVRRKPYSVVLLDEIEKAHPGVQDIFYQVFDKGMLKDGEGRDIDFKNTVIIMTSNVGTDTIAGLYEDPDTAPGAQGLLKAMKADLLDVFKPAFLGRVDVIPYIPLNDDVLTQIVKLQLSIVQTRVLKNYNARLTYSAKATQHIVSQCTEADAGARNIHKIIHQHILPSLSDYFLQSMMDEKTIKSVSIDVDKDAQFIYKLT